MGGGVYWSRGGWGPREGIMQEYIGYVKRLGLVLV